MQGPLTQNTMELQVVLNVFANNCNTLSLNDEVKTMKSSDTKQNLPSLKITFKIFVHETFH